MAGRVIKAERPNDQDGVTGLNRFGLSEVAQWREHRFVFTPEPHRRITAPPTPDTAPTPPPPPQSLQGLGEISLRSGVAGPATSKIDTILDRINASIASNSNEPSLRLSGLSLRRVLDQSRSPELVGAGH